MHVNRRGAPIIVGVAVMVALLGGCAGREDSTAGVDVAQLGGVQDAPPRVTVNPADGAAGVSPTERVTVAVVGGRITVVKLAGPDGQGLTGSLSPDGERWISSQPLRPNTGYTLTVISRSAWGQDTTSSTKFSTLAPGQRVSAKIAPSGGAPVRADQAVSVRFDKPVGDREAVEKALRVTASPAASGKTEWRSDRELLWRPDPAWPPGAKVTVSLDIFGKKLGDNMFGAADLRSAFSVVNDAPVAALAPSPDSSPSGDPEPPSGRPGSSAASAVNPRSSAALRAPAGERPAGERSAGERPAGERSAQRSAGERPAGERPAQRSAGERSAGEGPAAERPSASTWPSDSARPSGSARPPSASARPSGAASRPSTNPSAAP